MRSQQAQNECLDFRKDNKCYGKDGEGKQSRLHCDNIASGIHWFFLIDTRNRRLMSIHRPGFSEWRFLTINQRKLLCTIYYLFSSLIYAAFYVLFQLTSQELILCHYQISSFVDLFCFAFGKFNLLLTKCSLEVLSPPVPRHCYPGTQATVMQAPEWIQKSD